MLGLIALPYEVLSNIVGNVNFDDVFNLGLTCKALKYLLTEESICKSTVQVRAHSVGDCGVQRTQSAENAQCLRTL